MTESMQSLGGKARAASLSAEERQEIARKAAETRWTGGRTKYVIPLGSGEVELVFSGELTAEDFQDLISYIALFRKQAERRNQKSPAVNSDC